jgi:hypothetical protein
MRVLHTLPNAHRRKKIERCPLANQRLIRAAVWQRLQGPEPSTEQTGLSCASQGLAPDFPVRGFTPAKGRMYGFDPHPWLAAPMSALHTLSNAHLARESLRLAVSQIHVGAARQYL